MESNHAHYDADLADDAHDQVLRVFNELELPDLVGVTVAIGLLLSTLEHMRCPGCRALNAERAKTLIDECIGKDRSSLHRH
jgi:hypothetical protein